MPLAIFGIDWTMELTYMACAAAGGTVLVLQTALMLFGVGDGHDVDLHHDVGSDGGDHPDGFFSLFSVRALASFFTFFGLTGWMGTDNGWNPTVTVLCSTGAGFALMLLVGWMMRMQSKLQSRGNLDPKNALGQSARVYLRIPGRNAGFGKVTVKVQGRTAEFTAFTLGDELPTGALVKITRMTTPDTFEVAPLEGAKK
ncbi:MAG: hypothetical protein HOP15_18530 [Planctomycetes bacterium]|nr:hypothetical protein [Planctomycetota bacterium]